MSLDVRLVPRRGMDDRGDSLVADNSLDQRAVNHRAHHCRRRARLGIEPHHLVSVAREPRVKMLVLFTAGASMT